MFIAGLQKLTAKDFPGTIACLVFTQGCNFRCPYCQNYELVSTDYKACDALIDEHEILEFLEQRKKVLDGVVISGGEPTIQQGLKEFILKIKNLGYKVKLDTNRY